MKDIKEAYEIIVDTVKNVFEIIAEVILKSIIFILESTRFFSRLIYLILPYIMLIIGNQAYQDRGKITYGGEVFIPIIVIIVSLFWDELYKRYKNIRTTMPIPKERFTIVTGNKVEVENERLEELLLYVQEIEDYIEEGHFDK